MEYQTLSKTNEFRFKCPIFNADTKMSSCVKLRNMVWMGKRPEQRRGCQAAMDACKCPAAVIVSKMAMTQQVQSDDYGSQAPINGRLRKDVLARILPVIVPTSLTTRYRLSAAEADMISTANGRISTMLGHAPEARSESTVLRGKTRKSKAAASKKPVTPAVVEQAATTGDLSAAL